VSLDRESIVFLKLGGSLITDKALPHTPRLEILARLAGEITRARRDLPGLRILFGHGSGSYGHVPAKKYGTRLGVKTQEAWIGFAEVWREAAALNHLVLDALAEAGLPALAFSPLASVVASAGQVASWNLEPLKHALRQGLLPVIYGDVIFDCQLGGTILSTEDLFTHLARQLKPRRILLAGLETGVWSDFPTCTRLLSHISWSNWPEVQSTLQGSAATDVTGGMLSKVQISLDLAAEIDGLETYIFSGQEDGSVYRALLGEPGGTLISR
jgi:isopentenyl phosphate kinase